jgi:hypothetical protein
MEATDRVPLPPVVSVRTMPLPVVAKLGGHARSGAAGGGVDVVHHVLNRFAPAMETVKDVPELAGDGEIAAAGRRRPDALAVIQAPKGCWRENTCGCPAPSPSCRRFRRWSSSVPCTALKTLIPVPEELICATTPRPAPLMAFRIDCTSPPAVGVMVLLTEPLVMMMPDPNQFPPAEKRQKAALYSETLALRFDPVTGVPRPAPPLPVAIPNCSAGVPVTSVTVMLSPAAPVRSMPVVAERGGDSAHARGVDGRDNIAKCHG